MEDLTLPVDAIAPQVVEALLTRRRNVVLVAPTGSGKTTRIPEHLHKARPSLRILVVQPRRVACRAVARRVAKELGAWTGQEVGYITRGDVRTSERTTVTFVTDGILLQMFHVDPLLKRFDIVIFDEFHERRLMSDLALSLARRAQQAGAKLLIVAMSATIPGQDRLVQFLEAEPMNIDGRSFPVEIRHVCSRPKEHRLADRIVEQVQWVCREGPEGDILVFLPGKGEIEMVAAKLRDMVLPDLLVIPLHGDLSSGGQDQIFAATEDRKVILATNIAETSLTVPGVRTVIDSGLVREASYLPELGVNRLVLGTIAQDSATQRAGRAGREALGLCLRLWSKRQYEQLPATRPPEIHRVELSDLVLHLRAAGVERLEEFLFVDAPDPARLLAADALMETLDAYGPRKELNRIGTLMSRLNLPARFARMMVQAMEEGAEEDVASIIAMLMTPNVWKFPSGLREAAQESHFHMMATPVSDFDQLLKIFQEFGRQAHPRRFCHKHFLSFGAMREAQRLQERILKAVKELHASRPKETVTRESISRCLLSGLLDRVGRRREDGLFEMATGGLGKLARGSLLQGDWVCAGELYSGRERFHEATPASISFGFVFDPRLLSQVGKHLLTSRIHLREAFVHLNRVRITSQPFYLRLPMGEPAEGWLTVEEAREVQATQEQEGLQRGWQRAQVRSSPLGKGSVVLLRDRHIAIPTAVPEGQWWVEVRSGEEAWMRYRILDLPAQPPEPLDGTDVLVQQLLDP